MRALTLPPAALLVSSTASSPTLTVASGTCKRLWTSIASGQRFIDTKIRKRLRKAKEITFWESAKKNFLDDLVLCFLQFAGKASWCFVFFFHFIHVDYMLQWYLVGFVHMRGKILRSTYSKVTSHMTPLVLRICVWVRDAVLRAEI